MTIRLLRIVGLLSFLALSRSVAEDLSFRDGSYKIGVFGTERTFSYTCRGSEVGPVGPKLYCTQTWGWDGQGTDSITGSNLNAWNPAAHTGGFPEYSSYPMMSNVRRLPGVLVDLPAGTTSLTISGSFGASQRAIPGMGTHYWKTLWGGNLAVTAGVWTGDINSNNYSIAGSATPPDNMSYYEIMRPMFVVEAENGSWKYFTPASYFTYSSPNPLSSTESLRADDIYEEIPDHLLRSSLSNQKVLIPAGYSGKVKITISGFVVKFNIVRTLYRASFTTPFTGTVPAKYNIFEHTGVGMLPLADWSSLTFTATQPVLKGDLNSIVLLKGSKGSIPVKFALREE